MMQTDWIKQIGFAGAFTLAAVIGASGSAQAQDDSTEGNSIWNLEVEFNHYFNLTCN